MYPMKYLLISFTFIRSFWSSYFYMRRIKQSNRTYVHDRLGLHDAVQNSHPIHVFSILKYVSWTLIHQSIFYWQSFVLCTYMVDSLHMEGHNKRHFILYQYDRRYQIGLETPPPTHFTTVVLRSCMTSLN